MMFFQRGHVTEMWLPVARVFQLKYSNMGLTVDLKVFFHAIDSCKEAIGNEVP